MADEVKKEQKGYTIEVYQREDKWWSFRINGVESKYRSSNEAGLQRTINLILNGPSPNATVRLKPVKGAGKAMKGKVELVPDPVPTDDWSLKPTPSERVAAFLTRGKLGKKDEAS